MDKFDMIFSFYFYKGNKVFVIAKYFLDICFYNVFTWRRPLKKFDLVKMDPCKKWIPAKKQSSKAGPK